MERDEEKDTVELQPRSSRSNTPPPATRQETESSTPPPALPQCLGFIFRPAIKCENDFSPEPEPDELRSTQAHKFQGGKRDFLLETPIAQGSTGHRMGSTPEVRAEKRIPLQGWFPGEGGTVDGRGTPDDETTYGSHGISYNSVGQCDEE